MLFVLLEKYATIPTKTKTQKKNIIDNSCKVIIASPFIKNKKVYRK